MVMISESWKISINCGHPKDEKREILTVSTLFMYYSSIEIITGRQKFMIEP